MTARPSNPPNAVQDSNEVLRERLDTITRAYSRFVPRQFLNLLGIEDIRKVELGQQVERKMTVLFADIRNFTALSETMSPQENFNFLNSYLVQMEPVIAAHGGFIDKYIGDAIMALFPDSPDQALHCSQAMLQRLEEYNDGRQRAGYRPIRIGIGINTGIVILGTVGGAERMDGTVIGDAVNLAARMEKMTKEYRASVLISEYTLYSLDKPELWSIRFLDRTFVRGKQGTQSVFEVFNCEPPELREAKLAHQKHFDQALAYYHFDDILGAREQLLTYIAMVPDDTAAHAYLERCETFNDGIDSLRAELPYAWREEYAIGQAIVDSAHKRLLADMNALSTAVGDGALSEASSLLAHVHSSASRDFMGERQLMEEDSYPFLDLHTRQHERFFEFLAELRREIDLGDMDQVYLAFRVKRLLSGWLVNHILSADRHYGHYRNNRRVKQS
jgi:adenylate cyclase